MCIHLFVLFEKRIKKHVSHICSDLFALLFYSVLLRFIFASCLFSSFFRSNPELERQAAKGLEETIAALEKTSVATEAPASVPSIPEDAIGRLGRGFQTFKANHFE